MTQPRMGGPGVDGPGVDGPGVDGPGVDEPVGEPLDDAGVAVETRRAPDPARLQWYGWSLLAGGVGAAAAITAAGGRLPLVLPPVLPMVLLGALILLSFNRLAFFPSEWSATAEVAVLLAAVVGFSGDPPGTGARGAELLGPLVVAFACGPLDGVHWRQRAFWRMAYNSGNRMIATLLAAVVFDAVSRGGTWVTFALAALAASLVFAVVDLVVFLGFERIRGGSGMRSVLREGLLIDCLTVPLGLTGALAGLVATTVGWWAGALVLVPAGFAPEIVLVRARRLVGDPRGLQVLRAVAPFGVAGALVAVLSFVIVLPDPGVLACLVGLGLGSGLELRVDARHPVAPMVAVLVAAAVVVSGGATVGGAVVVAVVATAAACSLARRAHVWAPALAGAAAVASALAFEVRPSRAGALVAALLFEVAVVARLARIVWTTPLVCVAVALAYGWAALAATGAVLFGAVVFGAGMLAAGAAAVAWGAPPWASRVLAPWVGGRLLRRHRAALLALVIAAMGSSLAAANAPAANRETWVLLATAVVATVPAVVMLGVRQWRFAPRGRARDATLVLAVALVALLAFPALALERAGWAQLLIGGLLAVCVTIGWRISRLAEAASAPIGGPVAEDSSLR